MSILVNADTKVIVQGLTGGQGRFYGLRNRAYGTKVVGGVSPKKAGTDVEGIPVFASVEEAVAETGATATMVIVPAPAAAAAVLEAAEAGLELIVAVTEGIPMHDEARFYNRVTRDFPASRILGPNCPGLLTPGECNIGFIPAEVAKAGGPVGIVSRSGTLTYQALNELAAEGHRRHDVRRHRRRPGSGHELHRLPRAVRGRPRDQGRDHVRRDRRLGRRRSRRRSSRTKMSKPVVSYIAGVTAPPGKKMGHAGAIISGSKGTAQAKMAVLEDAGVRVATNPTAAGELMAEVVAGL